MKKNIILNYKVKLTKELIEVIDVKLNLIMDECNSIDDPDAMGFFDSAEHVTGFGFVALQTYMTAVYGILIIEKRIALTKGPKHESGNTIASIVNDAANYWKHHNEWTLDKGTQRKKIIRSTFESIGFPIDLDYPLCGVLTELSSPNYASLNALYTELLEWQNELEGMV